MEKKLLDSGIKNPDYIDLLDEDKPISTQKFVCLSFVSPENILKQKKLFLFEKFIKHYDFNNSIKKYHQFLNFLSFKYDINLEDLMSDFSSFIKEEQSNLLATTVEDDYKTFIESKGDDLSLEFNDIHNFQTNTRGIKVRGSFATQKEAEMKAKMLREIDVHHDIYVGEVGKWMPFNPDAFKTGKVEYIEEELNSIMNYKANKEEIDKVQFEQRIKRERERAVKKNMEKAKETGNKLTQRLDSDGNLIDNKNSIVSNNILDDVLTDNLSDISMNNNKFK